MLCMCEILQHIYTTITERDDFPVDKEDHPVERSHHSFLTFATEQN